MAAQQNQEVAKEEKKEKKEVAKWQEHGAHEKEESEHEPDYEQWEQDTKWSSHGWDSDSKDHETWQGGRWSARGEYEGWQRARESWWGTAKWSDDSEGTTWGNGYANADTWGNGYDDSRGGDGYAATWGNGYADTWGNVKKWGWSDSYENEDEPCDTAENKFWAEMDVSQDGADWYWYDDSDKATTGKVTYMICFIQCLNTTTTLFFNFPQDYQTTEIKNMFF